MSLDPGRELDPYDDGKPERLAAGVALLLALSLVGALLMWLLT